jgi:hypothetical protein
MNYRKVLIILTACFVTVAAVSGAAIATDYTFTGEEDNTWNEAGNWNPEDGPPGSGDKAIIPFGYTVTTDAEDAACLILDADGQVQITESSTLKIYGGNGNPSDVYGAIRFLAHGSESGDAVLEFQNPTVLQGPGLVAAENPAVRGIIRGTSGSTTLTIQRADEYTDPPLLTGDIDIAVALINEAKVLASTNCTITLTTYAKSGSGVWESNGGGALLIVDVGVSGGGHWVVNGGEIEIDAACTSLSGPVTMSSGTFDIDANFWTTGEITYSGGTINVDGTSAISASFGQ